MLRSLYSIHWSPLGESLYTLMIIVVGWSVWEISSICMSRSSIRSDLSVMEKSARGLKYVSVQGLGEF